MGSIELENGFAIQVCSSMVANPERPATIELYGVKGTAIYTHGNIPRLRFFGAKGKRIRPPIRGFHPLYRSLEGPDAG
jgi:hypothetical protein